VTVRTTKAALYRM